MIIYAVDQQQSHHFMRGYKLIPRPVQEHQFVVQALLWQALADHDACLAKLAGAPASHWATVPSLSNRAGPHPLNVITQPVMAIDEIALTPLSTGGDTRALDPGHFQMRHSAGPSHVLLIDDKWVSGGHAQSAALTLRAAGVPIVSILAVARFLKPPWPTTVDFLQRYPWQDFDPFVCCWTGGGCPR